MFEESQSIWSVLTNDLVKLNILQFSKYVIYKDNPSNLYIFCDSFKKTYGFAIYHIQDSISC